MKSCEGCERVKRAAQGAEPLLIHEFPGSLLFLGDHQYFEGYCVLLLKGHARELHELAPDAAEGFAQELAAASAAVAAAFKPWKLNHASLGNQMPHLHWHIFPRYESDPDRLQHPWLHSGEFQDYLPSPAKRDALIAKLRGALA